MDKPRNAEEQAFWDAAFIASLPFWEAYVARRMVSQDPAKTRAEWAAVLADDALEERRKRHEAPNASP